MSRFDRWFDERLQAPANTRLLGALQLIVDAQSEHLWRLSRTEAVHPGLKLAYSAREGDGISTSRTAAEILGKYGVTEEMLRDHVGGGTVVDIGAGQSSLLDTFPEARTIAVDATEQHVEFQSKKGHEPFHANATDLRGIPSETADLVVAHMSAPFWLDTLEEARQAEIEMRRITKAGGIILVGSLAVPTTHAHYESILSQLKKGQPVLPWDPDGEFALDACISTFFAKHLLSDRRQPDLINRATEVVGSRVWECRDPDLHRGWSELYVPNYLIVRKVA